MKVFILNLPAGRQACFRILNYERKFYTRRFCPKDSFGEINSE